MKKYFRVQPNEIRQYLANTEGRKSEKDWFAPMVFTGAMDLMEQTKSQQPFFLVADSYDPHEPWDPPEKYVSLYDSDGYDGPEPFNPIYGDDDYLTDSQLLRMRSLYAAEVSRWITGSGSSCRKPTISASWTTRFSSSSAITVASSANTATPASSATLCTRSFPIRCS